MATISLFDLGNQSALGISEELMLDQYFIILGAST
jgi:hypothetical protein